ncbi:hypothetical protein [Nocardia asiatica]|uniref:hypothetical protein n=2 Tax=Nocardia asiatica TaxID=209252 RepID=UPI0002E13C69|nr:hypothetical protein [Nocardia asiatica]
MSQPGGYPPHGQQPGQWPGQPAFGQQPPVGQYPPPQAPAQYAPPAGQHPSQPHLAQPQVGQPPYGQPAPQFGQPAPQYGQPQPYGAPQQFGQPQPYGQPQQFAPQQGYGQPADPPGITIDASYSVWAFLLALTKPKILVNGQRVPNTRWGANHIPVGPGQYHVRVATPWLFDMGPANVTVPIADGQAARFYYKAPVVIFLNGAIGPVPQKAPGMLFLYIVWALVGLMFLLNIVVIASI